MQINQHNYESFFLLYVDNELSPQEREMVDVFIGEHPDLAVELNLLKQTVFGVDEHIEFPGRQQLTRKADITEEQLLTYLDGEADTHLRAAIKEGISDEGHLKLELEDLSKLYLEADTSIHYPYKEKLYKTAIVRKFDWRKWAIAASLLLCVGSWMIFNQADEEADEARVAVNLPVVSEPVPPPVAADTHPNVDTPVIQEVSSAEENQQTIEMERKLWSKADRQVPVQLSGSLPVEGKPQVVTPNPVVGAGASGSGSKINQPAHSPDPVEVPVETATQPSSIEPFGSTVAVKEPVKEKKSLLKKIGKQISDRALDILSDGGDNINVAGFAIHVEK